MFLTSIQFTVGNSNIIVRPIICRSDDEADLIEKVGGAYYEALTPSFCVEQSDESIALGAKRLQRIFLEDTFGMAI